LLASCCFAVGGATEHLICPEADGPARSIAITNMPTAKRFAIFKSSFRYD
jgi:hypothetical protein